MLQLAALLAVLVVVLQQVLQMAALLALLLAVLVVVVGRSCVTPQDCVRPRNFSNATSRLYGIGSVLNSWKQKQHAPTAAAAAAAAAATVSSSLR